MAAHSNYSLHFSKFCIVTYKVAVKTCILVVGSKYAYERLTAATKGSQGLSTVKVFLVCKISVLRLGSDIMELIHVLGARICS